MLDSAPKWSPIPDWTAAQLDVPGLSISVVRGFEQTQVSGDLATALSRLGLRLPMASAFGLTRGDRYAVRLGRSQGLIVSRELLSIEPGWHSEGFAVSSMSAGFQVFQLVGDRLRDLLARAVTLDIEDESPSALVRFGGLTAIAYRWDRADCLRIHVDRGFAPYLWQWMTSRLLAMEGAEHLPAKLLKSQQHPIEGARHDEELEVRTGS